jgi:DNA replication protein DnaC
VDDTDLRRAHEREPVSRPAPRRTPTRPVRGDNTRPCESCGQPATLRLQGDLPLFLVELAELHLAGDAPVMCGACLDAEQREEEAAQAEAEHTELIARRRSASGIPPELLEEPVDDDEQSHHGLVRGREWAVHGGGLLLWGEVGCGKTTIAAWAANRRLERSPVRWLTVAELLQDLRMPYDSPEYAAALRKLKTHSKAALVLDDIDKSKPTVRAFEPVWNVINLWTRAKLPLLVTLNRDLDELAEWMPEELGESMVSRLAGYCVQVKMTGRDRRLARPRLAAVDDPPAAAGER